MRIHIASDHAAFELKETISAHLRGAGHDVVDHGAAKFDAEDDYPIMCIAAAEAVASEPGSLGVVMGGSGNGEQMAANKVKGIRAALAWNVDTAQLARQHNNANVVAVGARQHSTEQALEIVEAFVEARFSAAARHQRRIDMLSEYEAKRCDA